MAVPRTARRLCAALLVLLVTSTSDVEAQSEPSTETPAEPRACAGAPFEFRGETRYLVRPSAINGWTIAGRYDYPQHPSGRPRVELRTDGQGVYEVWGRDSSGGPGTDDLGEWWIMGDCAGNPVATETGPGGSMYVIVWRWASTVQSRHQAGEYGYSQMAVTNDGRIYINSERLRQATRAEGSASPN